MVFRKKDPLRSAEDEVTALRDRLAPLEARTAEVRARAEAAEASYRKLLVETAGADTAAAQQASDAVNAATAELRTYATALDELAGMLAQAEARVGRIHDERDRDARADEAEARAQRIAVAADAYDQAAEALSVARQHLRDVLIRDAPRDFMGQVPAYRFDAVAQHRIGYRPLSDTDVQAFGLDRDFRTATDKVCAPLLAAARALRTGESGVVVPLAGPRGPSRPAPVRAADRTVALWRAAYWHDEIGTRIEIPAPGLYGLPEPIACRALQIGAAFEPDSQEGQQILFVARNDPRARFSRNEHGALRLSGAKPHEPPLDLGSVTAAGPAVTMAAAE